MSVSSATTTTASGDHALKRAIDWKGAFWVASGVPALVVFSIGGIAGTVGIPAYTVWIVSMFMGFIQSFTYAEIAGLFPNKSGGASIYGAAAWLRYGKFIAPLSVWCNWVAWTPVLSLGSAIAAMWTDLVTNLVLLSIASVDATAYYFILAVSNCGYIIFNFLNLNAGWIHRIDSGHIARPYKAPTIILALGGIFAFVNAIFMGAGAKVWNPVALWWGLGIAALIIPVFAFRHYVQDKGQFPPRMMEDLGLKAGDLGEKKAGVLPYVVLIAGLAVVLISNWIFTI